ncbi:MAG: hypothetical protein CMI31_13305 [Opitutae bacterium]|nr:hypothetical protein [Opitutae bacterium]
MSKARVGVFVSAILLGFGLSAPTLTIDPSFADFNWLVKIFSPENLESTTYSILGVIGKLLDSGDLFLGVVLGLFSVIFPVAKLGLYWVATGCSLEVGRASNLLGWVHRAGKFSMAEVFALALIVVVVQTLPGGTTASVEWGAYVFVASILCSIFVSFSLDKASSSSPSN